MALDSWLYGDPEKIAIRRQEADAKRDGKCGGYANYQVLVIGHQKHHGCILKRRNWQACTFFETKKGQ